MPVWKQQPSSTINMICGQANCYSNCHIDYKSNIPFDLKGGFSGLCDKCNHSLWDHQRGRAKWEQVMTTQVLIDQNMKKWEAAKEGTKKIAILVAVREKVLHDLDQSIKSATTDLAQSVERYARVSLSGSFSVGVGSTVRLLEHQYFGLKERGVNQDRIQRVEERLSLMKRKLELLNTSKEHVRKERVGVGHQMKRVGVGHQMKRFFGLS